MITLDASAALTALLEVLESRPDLVKRFRALLARPTAPSLYLTTTQAAARYQVSRRTVQTWMSLGLPCIGTGKARRIDVRLADVWLTLRAEENTRAAT